MDDSRSGPPSGGGFPRPFIPGQPGSSAAGEGEPEQGGTFGDSIGRDQIPDVITDQVAELAPLAVELPSITEFVYDEPLRPTPVPTPPRATPAGARVRPLPGFSPAREVPAAEFPPAPRQPTPARPEPMHAWTPPPRPAERVTPAARAGGDWSTGEWQRYDWRSAASLAPAERARAAEAWADLDWENDPRSGLRQKNEAVAAALEGIARRVRSGELVVHGHPGMTEEAAAAAALAAILARRP